MPVAGAAGLGLTRQAIAWSATAERASLTPTIGATSRPVGPGNHVSSRALQTSQTTPRRGVYLKPSIAGHKRLCSDIIAQLAGQRGSTVAISEYLERSFRSTDNESRGVVLDAVKAAGFTVNWIEEDFSNPQKWGLILKPSRRVSELFRLDREVLLWYTDYGRFLARDIEDMQAAIKKHGVRLTRSFVLFVSRYNASTRSSVEAESSLDITIAHFSLDSLRAPRTGMEPTLLRLLLDKLYTRDLYDLPTATTRAADFFGRRRMVDSIADELITGQAQVGVFGLRKIGKTSLANRVIDSVTQSGRCIVAKIDLQWTTSIDVRPEHTLWSIGEAIYASGRVARNVRGFKLFGQYSMASEAASQVSIWEAFAHDMTRILTSTSRRIVIVLDEIERIFELGHEGGIVRLGRLLRGLDQQNPGRLRILVSGTSPECSERAVIDGEDNPFYQYLSIQYLGPLDQHDAIELLKELGQPIGLEWSPQALTYAFEQTGGHPALLRTIGSHVHRRCTPRSGPVEVTSSTTISAAQDVISTDTAILAQVTASLRDKYEDEYTMLEMLAQGQVHSFRQLASTYPDELSHLIGYGLLQNGSDSDRLASRMLQSYIQHLLSGADAKKISARTLAVGDKVDSRTIVSSISSGGFADVFLAVDESGSRTAIKAFRSAKLSSLEREVVYLRELDHPGIVKFIEATQSSNGVPCIVMDYVDGQTLAERCNATLAPLTGELLDITIALLDALHHMHPKTREAAQIANNHELSADEFRQWAQSKLGIIHRDIKPENVILGSSGPVLIDFNIAVRAADPVKTMSATPGYLPPSFDGQTWTPSVDLYQLGITLAQLAAGARYEDGNLEDLVGLCETQHGDRYAKLIRDLLDGQDSFDARTALAQAGSIRK